jgi:hypothetical protein
MVQVNKPDQPYAISQRNAAIGWMWLRLNNYFRAQVVPYLAHLWDLEKQASLRYLPSQGKTCRLHILQDLLIPGDVKANFHKLSCHAQLGGEMGMQACIMASLNAYGTGCQHVHTPVRSVAVAVLSGLLAATSTPPLAISCSRRPAAEPPCVANSPGAIPVAARRRATPPIRLAAGPLDCPASTSSGNTCHAGGIEVTRGTIWSEMSGCSLRTPAILQRNAWFAASASRKALLKSCSCRCRPAILACSSALRSWCSRIFSERFCRVRLAEFLHA